MTILQEPRIDEANRLFEEQRFEICCDYADRSWGCGGSAAKWIAVPRLNTGCGHAHARLICASCKDYITITDGLGECDACGAIYTPFRSAFSHFEPLGTT